MTTPSGPIEKVYILLQTAFENVGDALINKQLIDIVSASTPLVIDVSRAPSEFLSSLALESNPNVTIQRGGIVRLATNMLSAKFGGKRVAFLLMPGGNRGEKAWPKYVANRLYNQLLRLLSLLGVEILQVGVSYENLGPRYAKVIRERASLMKRLVVRDQLSKDYLTNLNIATHGILPDLAFNLEFDFDRLLDSSALAENDVSAFSFRTGKGFLSETQVRDFVAVAVTTLPTRKFRFVSQVKSDRGLMQDLCEDLQKSGVDAEFADFSEDLSLYTATYSDCRVIFSNRLHALLLATASGVRPVAVLRAGADQKIRGVFDAIEMTDRILDFDNSSADLSPISARPVSATSASRIADMKSQLVRGVTALLA